MKRITTRPQLTLSAPPVRVFPQTDYEFPDPLHQLIYLRQRAYAPQLSRRGGLLNIIHALRKSS